MICETQIDFLIPQSKNLLNFHFSQIIFFPKYDNLKYLAQMKLNKTEQRFRNIHWKTPVLESHLIMSLQLHKKRDSGTCVFL